MSEMLLAARLLHKRFHSLEVLRGVELEVEPGEFAAIEGPSGAGKSTLLHILGGLDFPSSGEVFFSGRDLYRLKENCRAAVRNKDIGFVFQFYHLLPELDVLENVVLPALLGSFAGKKRALAYARALLEEVGLSGRLQHRPNMLSGGEQQRAAIARALVNRPQLLLCDEPTGNLDSDNGKNILRLLKQLNKETGMAVLLVTHDKEVASFAERTIFLRDGRIDY